MSKGLAITETIIESKIYLIRGLKVMMDSDLAEMYSVETKVLKQAVKRNMPARRFVQAGINFQLTLCLVDFKRS